MDLYFAFDIIKEQKNLIDKKVGFFGHSKGGYAAICVYQEIPGIDFMILAATPVTEIDGRFLYYKSKLKGENYRKKVNFQSILKKIRIPILFITGNQDTIIDNTKSISELKKLNNRNISIKVLDDLNHFLKKGEIDWKDPQNRNSIYKINEVALNEVVNWTLKI